MWSSRRDTPLTVFARKLRQLRKPWAITATLRSGTTAMARYLQQSGFNCPHEGNFNPDRPFHPTIPLKTEGEVCWLAVPYLERLKQCDTHTILLVREPLAVMNSLSANHDFGERRLLNEFMSTHVAELRRDDLTNSEKSMWFWYRWMHLGLEQCDEIVWLDQFKFPDRTINHRNDVVPAITWATLPDEIREFIYELCVDLRARQT